MTLRERWEEQASNWIRWAREPGHDSYWKFHRESFLASLPAPGRLTIDVGCGEGRVTRDLRALGHRVVGVDSSPSMVAAAREADPDGEYVEADVGTLPFEDGSADLVVAFMSLMDLDDMAGAVREIGRVLEPGGAFVAAVVHPINSAGAFVPPDGGEDAPFVIDSYLERRPYTDRIDRDGLEMTFHAIHFTVEDYSRALEAGGFLIRRMREVYDDGNPRWSRVPMFLRLDAVTR
ncbi:MAG TPA: class I SAM-dependent methyltransferase [Gaiellaceae bacterium]|nr:class I SAM-dependent methyltransferase [Gaiellaceae bacterium]